MKNGAVKVPSPCISSKRLPFASTAMPTGEKNPGMLEEASSTSRNSLSPSAPPCAAIAPMFQTIGRPLSRLVVVT